ncbi:GAF domain-containing protein [uncultured Nocardioides sp.]|uniref:GAF domain-containing protein n=1 Tax=uncultured Nocardioides sp. TaxID=198441 RepID=UPI00261C037E|nr:GAF domain-containing protein [uncultured Nocardioides sp.]
MSANPPPDLTRILASTRTLYAAAACSCALVDDDGTGLTFVAADGAGAEAVRGVTLPVDRGVAGWVALSGQPTGIADVARDARFARDVAEATSYVPTSLLAVPMVDPDGEVVGVVEVLDPTAEHLGLAVLAVVASQLEAVVRHTASTDDEGVDPALAAVVRRVRPDQAPLARALLEALVERS